MEPLSKEEIDAFECQLILDGPYIVGINTLPMIWRRLLYTARLGAEFVKQTQKSLDTEAKKV